MGTQENNIQAQIMMALSDAGCSIFRNNVGMGWAGKSRRGENKETFVSSRDVVVLNARPLHAGLLKGSSDLIGWIPVVVTQEMVGTTVAIFVASEVKTATGKRTPEQKNWINAVNRDGGRAGIARSAAEAVEIACKP